MTAVSAIYHHAFVTGASTGLGRAFADMLLADGVRVWGTSRDPARLDDLVQRHGANFTPVALDLRDGAAAEKVFLEIDQAARCDLVINNAGYGVFGQFATTDFEHWREQMEVMLVNTARI